MIGRHDGKLHRRQAGLIDEAMARMRRRREMGVPVGVASTNMLVQELCRSDRIPVFILLPARTHACTTTALAQWSQVNLNRCRAGGIGVQDVKATLVDAVQRDVLLSAHSMNMLLRALVRAQAPAMAAVLFYRPFPQNYHMSVRSCTCACTHAERKNDG